MPQQFKITDDESGARLDRWFRKKFPDVTHSFLQQMLRKKEVKVNGKKIEANYRINSGDVVEVKDFKEIKKPEGPVKTKIKISEHDVKDLIKNIIYKDDNIIAINKPQGLAAQGGSGLSISVDYMLDYLKFGNEERPKLVHRIDKDTSGVMILARSAKAAAILGQMFKDKSIEKTYWAVVVGLPAIEKGKIDIPILAKKAQGKIEKAAVDEDEGSSATTYYNVLDNAGNSISFVELMPITGRMHQLRVHMAHIGNPILGDGKYGGKKAFIEGVGETMHLHARKIKFNFMGKKIEITSPLPKHMRETFRMFNFEAD